jgi:subtilase-type serine protease
MSFVNSGTVDVQTGTVQVAQNFNNQGNIHVDTGATFGATGANLTNYTNGSISGQGTIDPLITLINLGVTHPGENGLGTLHVAGNYQQSSTGILDIGIGGSSSLGVLDIQGNATWGGALKVTSLGGFMPTIDELFTVALFSGTFTGQFASLDTSAFSGVTFSTIYDSHDVTLKVIAVNAVPLPPALWLFGSALIGMALTGIRKKKKTTPDLLHLICS